jgi:hypothetical protein
MTKSSTADDILVRDSAAGFERVPGLFRRWEFDQLFDAGFDYHIEEHGRDTCGTRLFAIYKRESPEEEVSA